MSDSDDGRRRSVESSAEAAGDADVAEATEDANEVVVERLPPDEAFELLAHELRFRILETLNDADGPLAFSELRERVDVADPGQFNYHLGKLTGRFVRDGDEGYELAASGRRIVGAVLSGGYTKALDAEPVETDVPCIVCEGEMDVQFRDDGVDFRCRECELTFTNANLPAGALEGVAPDDIPAVIDRWLKRNLAGGDFGFCYNCDGRLDTSIRFEDREEAEEPIAEHAPFAAVRYECERCGFSWYSSFPFVVLLHPAVVGFHYEHGVDVRSTPFWELDSMEVGASTVESRDPFRVDVSMTLDGETAVFTFDEDLNVVEERRE